jgi:hypothetical protein
MAEQGTRTVGMQTTTGPYGLMNPLSQGGMNSTIEARHPRTPLSQARERNSRAPFSELRTLAITSIRHLFELVVPHR